MQVIVTGSRDFADDNMVWDELSLLWSASDPSEAFTVVHDGSAGPASIASSWVRAMRVHYRVFEDKHHKDWDEILRGGADRVLIFFHDKDDAQTLKRFAAAKLAGLEIVVHKES